VCACCVRDTCSLRLLFSLTPESNLPCLFPTINFPPSPKTKTKTKTKTKCAASRDDTWTALSPALGRDVWESAISARARDLEEAGEFHVAAAFYLAALAPREAVAMYSAAGMHREAVALARCGILTFFENFV
jgi:hypothetical protein